MRMNGREPVVPRFRLRDGQFAALEFARGASVMKGADAQLRPKENAIYSMDYSMDASGRKLKKCTVDVYRWNPDAGTFDYDQGLSKTAAADYCLTAGR
jgi:hypothetical protein